MRAIPNVCVPERDKPMLATAHPITVAPVSTQTTTTVRSTPRRTLLVVDDEEGPRQSLRVVFRNEYDLLLAADGATALELARKHRVDVAILDLRMSGMGGIEVLQGLKTVDPHIEVIMLTAYETIDSARQALRLGACDYLNKPFEIGTIRTAVANAMERRTLSFEIRANSEKLHKLQDELQNQRLEEAMIRSRGEIYASIIHDINGPLTIISGFLQLINQKMGNEARIEGEELENVKDRLRRITKQVTNCIDISRRYLSFLRQNPGETLEVSVNQCLADLGELMRVHPAVRNNELLIKPLTEDRMVQINGTDLIQSLRNLIVNALQCSTERHRVLVRGAVIEAPVPEINGPTDRLVPTESFVNSGPMLSLSVEDTGPGISPENMQKLFAKSFTTQEAGKGTGLGLIIVHRLVARARGAIHVHTQPGQGTTFTVLLPLT
jgi:two-component system, sensor histidine kinase and response regulator